MSERAVLVLAAGRARRFGADKRLANLQGKPVITHVLEALHGAGIPATAVHVCVAPGDQALAEPSLLPCPNAHQGLGHTLADAVSALPEAAGWLVCLADMPFIQTSTYAALWAQAPHHRLLAPCWQGQRGHPVYFDQYWRADLCQLRGDTGARSLLKRYHEHLALLSVEDPGITLDIDTPSDLNKPLVL